LNGLIQPFQQPERVVGFFNFYRRLYPVNREVLRGIAGQFQEWVKQWSEKRAVPMVDAPKGRRDEFVDPYFKGARPDHPVIIIKAREPARIMTAIGDKIANRWHLQIADRWVIQHNFYINDRQWGRMFVRLGPPVDDELLYRVVDAMDGIAKQTGKTMSQIALNWLLQRPTVSTIVIGARNEEQLRQNLGAVGWTLTPEQIRHLDEASAVTPAYPYWHQNQFGERNPKPV
jgi:Aldo/keto reductase family